MKKPFLLSGISFLLFALLIVLIKTVDVAAIGPAETEVGFSALNQMVHTSIGVNTGWYMLTEVLGILALLNAAVFALMGLQQLIQRKSLFKVDQEIFLLGTLYVVMLGFYLAFNMIAVSYRPVLMAGELTPEASFPSSHSMLACVVFGSSISMLQRYLHSGKLKQILSIGLIVLMVLVVAGRLLSGVHWFTDILGGVLLSAGLVFLFKGALDLVPEKKNDKV